MVRIEMPPAQETQLDYGKVGLLFDVAEGRNRTVHAFCGVLSHSRLPFVQFAFSQDERMFAGSIVDMVEYYDGVTEFLSMDNLKAGVIKPDLYDPTLNKSLAELADHYGVFINTCRVATPTDKAKVERFIPVARELFRKLKYLHPTADIRTLNGLALDWCREEYGKREHGTTKRPPMEVFMTTEKSRLKPLPAERFETPQWKEAPVHPDQFFTYAGKRYSLPSFYKHKRVWIRENGRILRVFYDQRLVREYVMTAKMVNYVPEDFPETVREMMNGGYPRYLLDQSRVFGEDAFNLVESVLSPHAYLNARRARGMLTVMEKHAAYPYFNEICRSALAKRVKLPSTFTKMCEAAAEQLHFDFTMEMSEEGRSMVRPIMDFFRTTKNGGTHGTGTPLERIAQTAEAAGNDEQSRDPHPGGPGTEPGLFGILLTPGAG
jgi:hypothetical protein